MEISEFFSYGSSIFDRNRKISESYFVCWGQFFKVVEVEMKLDVYQVVGCLWIVNGSSGEVMNLWDLRKGNC